MPALVRCLCSIVVVLLGSHIAVPAASARDMSEAAAQPGAVHVVFNACPSGAGAYVVGNDGQPGYSIGLQEKSGPSDISITIKQSNTGATLTGVASGGGWSFDASLPSFGYDSLMRIIGLNHILYVSVDVQQQGAALQLRGFNISDTGRSCP